MNERQSNDMPADMVTAAYCALGNTQRQLRAIEARWREDREQASRLRMAIVDALACLDAGDADAARRVLTAEVTP